MTKLNDLQQSQIKLLKSIISLAETRAKFIEVQNQQPEIDRQINELENNLKEGLKVVWQMQNANYPSLVISNALKSLPCITQPA